MPRELPVTALMDVGAGDEAGTADDEIVRCECGVLYRADGRHRCEGGEWV